MRTHHRKHTLEVCVQAAGCYLTVLAALVSLVIVIVSRSVSRLIQASFSAFGFAGHLVHVPF